MKGVIALPQDLNINSVGSIVEEAKEIMNNEDEMILDAKDVEVVDALGLQVIVSIQKTAIVNNIKFEVINARPTLQKYLSYL